MILSSLQAMTRIVQENLPTQVFLTTINNMISMTNMIRNAFSQPIDLVVNINGANITINPHTRKYLDGKTSLMPGGNLTTTLTTYWLIYDRTYQVTDTQPIQGNVLVIGYYNGTFTPYRLGNV